MSSIRWACLSTVKLQILLSLFTITSGICSKKKRVDQYEIEVFPVMSYYRYSKEIEEFFPYRSLSSSIHFSSIVFIFIYSHSVGLWTISWSTSNFIVSISTIHFSEEHTHSLPEVWIRFCFFFFSAIIYHFVTRNVL